MIFAMMFAGPLESGTLLRRYKRFLADIALDHGTTVTAHCTSTGTMMGLVDPGTRVWVSQSASPSRRYPYTWELVQEDSRYIGVNTRMPNLLFREAFEKGNLSSFEAYEHFQAEVSFWDSRLDFSLTPFPPALEHVPVALAYGEIKNVHLRMGSMALFPDAVTTRGTRHMKALQHAAEQGLAAYMVYVIQRCDVHSFAVAAAIDPAYAQAFQEARKAGVTVLAYTCQVSPEAIVLHEPVTVLDPFLDPVVYTL